MAIVAAVVDSPGVGQAVAGRLQPLTENGSPVGPPEEIEDLVSAVARRERDEAPRWLWASTATSYQALLRAGIRVARCHDLELTEGLLLGYQGRWGEPKALGALWARRHGLPVPADPPPPGHRGAAAPVQASLFDELPSAPSGYDELEALVEGYRDQLERIGAAQHPGRLRLLASVESAGGLVAAEMGYDGLPWREQAHDELLVELLGEPSPVGPPRHLVELTEQIRAAFADPRLHPESPAELRRAFARAGIEIPSTRAWVLQRVDHPAVPLLLEFKELYRIWTAHGWAWRAQWVRNGRFHPEYVPGGVVSGRWATRGGGALQIPKAVRRAVVADDGWALVVADAGQLEPRVLAAISGDTRLAAAASAGDLYAELAAEAFAGDRAKAKLALLGAMYGQTGGAAMPALAALSAGYPLAWQFVEQAARTGEAGGLVRSWLGRTCPAASDEPMTAAQARARGRFTRNFVVQASAAEWALALLAGSRNRLSGTQARLVFFQHDEVLVHTPAEGVEEVIEAVRTSGERAGRVLFGHTPVRFPLDVSVVSCYADAK